MRDLRDPQILGDNLLYLKNIQGYKDITPHRTLSQIYDQDNVEAPDVSKDDSMGKQCAREYRAELEARAAEGDKYAQSALESINAGEGVQGYDDAGA